MSGELGRIVPVIMAGGKGTRLWPISRSSRPKQFLSLAGSDSLFQQTLKRVGDSEKFASPVIVTNAEYRFLVAEQAQEMGIELGAILLEPIARNTSAAILAAAKYLDHVQNENKLVYALASDHRIIEENNLFVVTSYDSQGSLKDYKESIEEFSN